MIICSKSERNVAAMPAVSCIPVSNDPPLVAMSIERFSRTNATIRKSKKFSINWVDNGKPAGKRSILCLAKRGISMDKLKENNVRYQVKAGTPVIVGCAAFATCHVQKIIHLGDHDLFVARVIQARASRRGFRRYWIFKIYKPSLYLGSKYKNPIVRILLNKDSSARITE